MKLVVLLIGLSLAITALLFLIYIKHVNKRKSSAEQYKEKSIFVKLVISMKEMIRFSGINHYTDKYSINAHVMSSVTCAFLCFVFSNEKILEIRIILVLIGFSIPFLLLRALKIKMNNDLSKHAISFIVDIDAALEYETDFFAIVESVIDNTKPPLKSYLKRFIDEYAWKVPPNVCIENLKRAVGKNELKLFLQQIQIAIDKGGDMRSICNKFINNMSDIEDILEDDKAENKMHDYGLLAIIFINIIVLMAIVDMPLYHTFVSETFIGKSLIVFDGLLTFKLILRAIKEG